MDAVKQFGGITNPWLVFKTYDDNIVNQCTQTMLAKWKDRLGGADEFMSSQCSKMAESYQ